MYNQKTVSKRRLVATNRYNRFSNTLTRLEPFVDSNAVSAAIKKFIEANFTPLSKTTPWESAFKHKNFVKHFGIYAGEQCPAVASTMVTVFHNTATIKFHFVNRGPEDRENIRQFKDRVTLYKGGPLTIIPYGFQIRIDLENTNLPKVYRARKPQLIEPGEMSFDVRDMTMDKLVEINDATSNEIKRRKVEEIRAQMNVLVRQLEELTK